MRQHSITFGFEARYFQLGEITDSTREIIFVLHGYGQQAKYFIRKFNSISTAETCIIAPEGLNRFYTEGFSGRVGATWMTKEDRLTDIKNYITYLNAIYDQLLPAGNGNIKISIIGFSQGAATASRWAADEHVPFHRLILWAGIFPPDMDIENATDKLRGKSIYYVYGTDDPFLTKETLIEMKQLSGKLRVKPVNLIFEGKHDIDEGPLKKIFMND
ncbi:hypothetical protein C900_03753 [Fulvivirga imtechensis AK7]|uniref:Phospholipase/carboxylesterase/thioesterase domain-containing protein n=1 Tax=Fulvivirga imtechensis AK7 TaxID=1237149 RepID=L8JSC9_9BACT|nr:hypothetical protein [Fulvivirga imtechensis]ELR70399.1 hypothetical protein C900_03753 [Fulvivirga imtechensis AK7]